MTFHKKVLRCVRSRGDDGITWKGGSAMGQASRRGGRGLHGQWTGRSRRVKWERGLCVYRQRFRKVQEGFENEQVVPFNCHTRGNLMRNVG